MTLENDIAALVNERRAAINAFRSGLQFIGLGTQIPPELLVQTNQYRAQRILCTSCEPELLMIADPSFYRKNKDTLAKLNGGFDASPVVFGHGLGITPERAHTINFVGVRGMKFSISDQGKHIDYVNIDAGSSHAYFHELKKKGEEEQFIRDYFTHIRQSERKHVIMTRSVYVAFVSRNNEDYFVAEAAARIR